MGDSEDAVDEWRDLVVSPKGLFSGFSPEPCVTKSIADVFSDRKGIWGGDDDKEMENSVFDFGKKLEDCGQGWDSSIVEDDLDVPMAGGSIVDTRAAKLGFNAPNTSSPPFSSSSPLPSPGSRSPYLITPASISPTGLLDSPPLLPNSQVLLFHILGVSIRPCLNQWVLKLDCCLY